MNTKIHSYLSLLTTTRWSLYSHFALLNSCLGEAITTVPTQFCFLIRRYIHCIIPWISVFQALLIFHSNLTHTHRHTLPKMKPNKMHKTTLSFTGSYAWSFLLHFISLIVQEGNAGCYWLH